jgi:hypothetical protein
MLTDKELAHPADALATALDRVSALLGVLGDFYNPSSDNFAGGNSFVMYSMATAQTLVADARNALGDLHNNCDLTLLSPSTLEEVVATVSAAAVTPAVVPPPVEAPVEPLSWKVEQRATVAEAQPAAVVPAPSPASEQDQFAKSYLELLRKLTAAEVFASEQQALAAPGSTPELLPLLRGLREDFQKMHNVG